jgi:hypothetical protein
MSVYWSLVPKEHPLLLPIPYTSAASSFHLPLDPSTSSLYHPPSSLPIPHPHLTRSQPLPTSSCFYYLPRALRLLSLPLEHPLTYSIGPAFAIPAVLTKAGISKDDVDFYEINEAFASQAVMSIQHLHLPYEKVRPPPLPSLPFPSCSFSS